MKIKSKRYLLPLFTLIIGLIWIYLGIGTYKLYEGGRPGSGFFPTVVAVLLICTSIIMLMGSFKAEKGDFKLIQFLPIAGILGIVLISFLSGTILAIFIFLFAWLRFFEKYETKFSLLISAIVTVAIWAIFGIWIGVQFEPGLIAKIINFTM